MLKILITLGCILEVRVNSGLEVSEPAAEWETHPVVLTDPAAIQIHIYYTLFSGKIFPRPGKRSTATQLY
jgi:hypothetical protein